MPAASTDPTQQRRRTGMIMAPFHLQCVPNWVLKKTLFRLNVHGSTAFNLSIKICTYITTMRGWSVTRSVQIKLKFLLVSSTLMLICLQLQMYLCIIYFFPYSPPQKNQSKGQAVLGWRDLNHGVVLSSALCRPALPTWLITTLTYVTDDSTGSWDGEKKNTRRSARVEEETRVGSSVWTDTDESTVEWTAELCRTVDKDEGSHSPHREHWTPHHHHHADGHVQRLLPIKFIAAPPAPPIYIFFKTIKNKIKYCIMSKCINDCVSVWVYGTWGIG